MWTSGYNLNQLDRFFLYMRNAETGAILGGTLLEFAMKAIGIFALAFRLGDRVRIRRSASRRSRSHRFPAVRNRLWRSIGLVLVARSHPLLRGARE